jgi:hypothetical protein
MDLNSKVYILVDNPRSPNNYLPAEKYGELRILFGHNISPTHLQRIFPELRQKLEYVTVNDYLIPTGSPALIALAGHLWLSKLGVINLLTWDRETQQYYNVRALA